MIYPCHFQSFLDVLALRSQFPNFSGIWLLISFQHGQWYNLCFSVPSSSLHPQHFFSSDQPMSYDLFCTHPPSTSSVLITCGCLSVTIRWSFFAAWPISSSRPFWLVSEACVFYILREDHSHVHRFLSFKHQGVPLWPLDAQVTGLAHNGSCRSSHLPPRLNLKKLLPPSLPSALMPIFPSQIPLSKPTWPILPPLPKYSLPCNVRATPIPSHLLLLSFVLLNLSLSVGAMPTAWHLHSQGPKPAPNHSLTRIPM